MMVSINLRCEVRRRDIPVLKGGGAGEEGVCVCGGVCYNSDTARLLTCKNI